MNTQDRILAGVMVLLWLLALAAIWVTSRQTDGILVYGLDDAYIHMAIAKNLVHHAVFGITPYAFTPSSSSVFWTLLLAVFSIPFGPWESLPFVLNVLFGTLTIILSSHILRREKVPVPLTGAALILIVAGTPFVVLARGGMEHSLHAVLLLLFAWKSAELLARGPAHGRRQLLILLGLAALMPLVRLESYALIFLVGGWLFLQGRWRLTVALAACSVVPLVVFQLVAFSHGWPLIPNSVLLRLPAVAIAAPGPASLEQHGSSVFLRLWTSFLHNVQSAPELPAGAVFLAGGVLLPQFRRAGQSGRGTIFGLLASMAIVSHLVCGNVGHLYRYEAYLYPLMVTGLCVAGTTIVPVLRQQTRTRKAATLGAATVFAVISILLAVRGYRAAGDAVQASVNIYEQQYQMARFVEEKYDKEAVMLNDIGAVSFYSEARIIDLAGLANAEVTTAKRNRTFGPELIRHLAGVNGVRFAVLYEEWFQRDGYSILPAKWEKVEEWQISHNIICSHDRVAFFGTDSLSACSLRRRLDQFATSLPPTVVRRTFLHGEGVSRQPSATARP